MCYCFFQLTLIISLYGNLLIRIRLILISIIVMKGNLNHDATFKFATVFLVYSDLCRFWVEVYYTSWVIVGGRIRILMIRFLKLCYCLWIVGYVGSSKMGRSSWTSLQQNKSQVLLYHLHPIKMSIKKVSNKNVFNTYKLCKVEELFLCTYLQIDLLSRKAWTTRAC